MCLVVSPEFFGVHTNRPTGTHRGSVINGSAGSRAAGGCAAPTAVVQAGIMSREATGDVPLGAGATGGNRLVSEPAFELLFSEIIAYTGAYVSHSAASHATDMFRAAEAGGGEEDGGGDDNGGRGDDSGATGALVEPSPASVGAGNRLLPVS